MERVSIQGSDKPQMYDIYTSLMKSTEHRLHKRLNNLIEKSYQLTREKERQMRKFKSVTSVQKLLSFMSSCNNLLKINLYKHSAAIYRQN
ncbi:IS6 family transposase domain protein [Candidatus Trichorickettsia mobilis]|uniref:IS6 family transposase domain protein n=1 Tax=Candidatus Trichorickettsia mobilis TaxID=1346319 RepID=A0ABZ0UVX1_9RICK|nr:IS6 family transposase domain protein [Candidatus Trichorickettsia mobilis]